jgi:pantoate--beta-alanine ligase
LFNMVTPDVAVFGQKDAQQAALIQRMVRDLNFAVEIVVAPIVREADGLAMSSRNIYLSEEERAQAVWISRALFEAASAAAGGNADSAELEAGMRTLLSHEAPRVEVEYIGIVDRESLAPTGTACPGTLVAIAVRVGKTRLIDNVVL